MLTERDIFLFKEGTHSRLYEKFGCHLAERVVLRMGAQRAARPAIDGWNGWNQDAHPLHARGDG